MTSCVCFNEVYPVGQCRLILHMPPTNPWRLILHPPQSATVNMAVDAAIARAFGAGRIPPTLRLYSWSHPSFSIGRFQKLDANLVAQLHHHDISIVRRITGGRGVLHDRELTYSIVASTQDEHFVGGLRGTFGAIAQGLRAGLKTLGVAAEIHRSRASGRRRSHGPFCFDHVSGDEITVGGRKLLGSAQRRWVGHFLQHGSLVLLRGAHAQRLSAPCPAALQDLVPSQVSLAEIQTALINAMAETLSVQFKAGALTVEEVADADRLALSFQAAGTTIQRRITGLPSRSAISNFSAAAATFPPASSLTILK